MYLCGNTSLVLLGFILYYKLKLNFFSVWPVNIVVILDDMPFIVMYYMCRVVVFFSSCLSSKLLCSMLDCQAAFAVNACVLYRLPAIDRDKFTACKPKIVDGFLFCSVFYGVDLLQGTVELLLQMSYCVLGSP